MTEEEQKQLDVLKRQENQYAFPYHYVPTREGDTYRQTCIFDWGPEYFEYIDYVTELLKQINYKSLLDIGCGDGRFLREVVNAIPDRIYKGIDISEASIRFAKAFNPNTDFVSGDITEANVLDRKYDVIILIETIEHIPQNLLPKFLKAVSQHLAPNGKIVITVPSKAWPTHPKHFQHFDRESLTSTLEPLFNIESWHFLNRKSYLYSQMRRFCANKYFAITHGKILDKFYAYYRSKLSKATEQNAERLCVICTV